MDDYLPELFQCLLFNLASHWLHVQRVEGIVLFEFWFITSKFQKVGLLSIVLDVLGEIDCVFVRVQNYVAQP